MGEDVKIVNDNPDSPSAPVKTASYQRELRAQERLGRVQGRLTDLTYADLTRTRGGAVDFIRPNTLKSICGSISQFDGRAGPMRALLPPLTSDCCQTFSTLSAVLLSSLGTGVMLTECCTTSTVNYLLYISAWMHQLTSTSWPQKGLRPTLGDLNTSLYLRNFFPATICDGAFEVVFYNQPHKAMTLLRQMCTVGTDRKRQLGENRATAVSGYVIVSGDYTISIFSILHDGSSSLKSRYAKAWSFYICDSHGTQPWSLQKASICGLTFGIPSAEASTSVSSSSGSVPEDSISMEDGLHYFSTMLFVLLEQHRQQGVLSQAQVPYMTWTPIRRRRLLAYTADEIKAIIDNLWIPKVISAEAVKREARRYSFNPLECFWEISSKPFIKDDNTSTL
ncbi:unnamed protein product [Phytomonas sp. Hart1]|nr:unnamed protein product [Phytomonas sp. Hart1]|eukprot:CCW69005.1 unnamed protein product [Phytomonas sp. isolate Hart1]